MSTVLLGKTCRCGRYFVQVHRPVVYVNTFPVPNHPRGLCRPCCRKVLA